MFWENVGSSVSLCETPRNPFLHTCLRTVSCKFIEEGLGSRNVPLICVKTQKQ